MKKVLSLTMLAAAIMLPSAHADTIIGATCAATLTCPTVTLTVGGVVIGATVTITPVNENVYNIQWSAISGGGAALGGYEFSGNINTDSDPQVSYGFTFSNGTGVDQDFTATVSTPFIGGPYVTAYSTYSGSVTDGGDGVVSVTPSTGLTAIHNPNASGVGSFGAITGGCAGVVAAHSSTACGQGNILGIPVVSDATGVINIDIGARVSAGDVFTLNGVAGLETVLENTPEPATYSLFAGALCFAGLFRRRK